MLSTECVSTICIAEVYSVCHPNIFSPKKSASQVKISLTKE